MEKRRHLRNAHPNSGNIATPSWAPRATAPTRSKSFEVKGLSDSIRRETGEDITVDSEAIKRAAQHFVDARRNGAACPPLPAALQPQTPEDGHAIQDATVAALN